MKYDEWLKSKSVLGSQLRQLRQDALPPNGTTGPLGNWEFPEADVRNIVNRFKKLPIEEQKQVMNEIGINPGGTQSFNAKLVDTYLRATYNAWKLTYGH